MKKDINPISLEKEIGKTFSCLEKVIEKQEAYLDLQEIGIIASVGKGVVKANGLPNVKSGEIVTFK